MESNGIGLKYDLWCIGWIIYELCVKESAKEKLERIKNNNWEIPNLSKSYRNLRKTYQK